MRSGGGVRFLRNIGYDLFDYGTKDPKVALRQIDGICMGEYDMRDYVTYQWFNNVPEVDWEVKSVSGGTGYTIDNVHVEYPRITFNKPGDYSVKVSLVSHTMGCEEDSLQDIKTFHIYDPAILGDITMVGNGEICEGETVTFMNTTNVDGESVGNGGWKARKTGMSLKTEAKRRLASCLSLLLRNMGITGYSRRR